jgi:hypothetical protein
MKVEIQQNHDSIEIVAYRGDRKVYCIEKVENGSWQIALATMPTGTVDEARDICRLSLKCHDLLQKFKNGWVEVGCTVFLGI